jgi:hypothetical protein
MQSKLVSTICVAVLIMAASATALAQYGGGGGTGGTTGGAYTPGSRSYGNGAKIGVAVGAAAGAGALFYILHRRHSQVVGCVSSDGTALKADNSNQTFELTGTPVTAGEHIAVVGKKARGDELEVISIKKDLGQCEQQADLVSQPQ